MYVRIGGIRLGSFGLLAIGWAVIPLYILFKSLEGLVRLFLALMGALDRHNRRRAVRKAYERDRLAKQAALAANQPYRPWTLQQPWQYGAPQQKVRFLNQPDPWQPGEKPGWR